MISVLNQLRDYHNLVFSLVNSLVTPALVGVRFYIGWLFFKSGLTKIDNWESTLFLFEYEYMVPIISYELAATLATVGELVLPVLLMSGLLTRVSAIGLSVINVIAVIAYADMTMASFNMHILWGVLLAMLVFLGGGKVSIDKLLKIS